MAAIEYVRGPSVWTRLATRLQREPSSEGSLIVGRPRVLAHVQTFGALVDNFICDIGAASENAEHANSRMVIEHENVVLLVDRYLGTPVALSASEYAKELASRHAVMLSIDPHPDEFLKVHRLVPSYPAATAATVCHAER